jgi:cullin 3
VQVLTTGSWPTPGNGSVPQCTLPPQLAAACERYKEFYLSSHNGRRLSWLTCMGTADLRATFGETKRELSVSTYQMCILLLFNDVDSMSYKDILAATHIPADDLKRSLQSLACVKGRNVLRKEPMSKEVNDDDVFVFNERFTSKLLKVKIGTVSAQRESEPEKRETRQRIEDDRKPQIEAAIVRIMKARRQLDHNGVVTEVTKQLTSRFVPNPTDIKKHLENLIEREFIERDRNDRKLYIYLA